MYTKTSFQSDNKDIGFRNTNRKSDVYFRRDLRFHVMFKSVRLENVTHLMKITRNRQPIV
jgi:hypothetical protein